MMTAEKQITPSIRRSKDQGVQTYYVNTSGILPADDYVYKIQLRHQKV